MKIIACARMLNEERNIRAFLDGHVSWVDQVILSDGGSTDHTLEIASQYPKVILRHFDVRVPCPQDPSRWANNENLHYNTLLQEVLTELPDWIVYDDLDSRPNYLLRNAARSILENTSGNAVMAHRLYVWMQDQYFPRMNDPGQSIWAWKPSEVTLFATGADPFSMEYTLMGDIRYHYIDKPFVLLHRYLPTPEAYAEKWARYAAWGRPQRNPLEACGPLEKLPGWAIE